MENSLITVFFGGGGGVGEGVIYKLRGNGDLLRVFSSVDLESVLTTVKYIRPLKVYHKTIEGGNTIYSGLQIGFIASCTFSSRELVPSNR